MAPTRVGFVTTLPDSPWEDEGALLRGLQQGDPCATEYVVQQYAPALYRYAYYQLQNRAEAEDLVA